MCGICGFNWESATLARAMTDLIRHRGPDQDGVYCGGGWSLGHRRLSIIDLSEHGRQPMANEDRKIHVVFNGEIYNFAPIREDLIRKGHVFESHSDTEVIIHAYEEYGIDAIRQFNGEFAIALLDEKKNELFLVRDRLGIKPLYYHEADGRFVFASEIKAILACPEVPRAVNLDAVYRYLCFEFVPAPDTMFTGISKLPAGHYLHIRNGRSTLHQYWDIDFRGAPVTRPGEAVEGIRTLMEDAVRARLLSDVPLGAFLSGGLDSSAIVAMMRKHITGPLRTFTIGYHDKSFSELDYARIIADRFGTQHHVLMIEDMTPALIEKSIWHFDEPMTDLSSIPLMLICGEARKDITVTLSGEGGDEVFAGYDRFKASRLNRYLGILPGPLRRPLCRGVAGLLPDRPQKKGAINMLKRFLQGAALPDEGMHLRWQFFMEDRFVRHLFTDSFRQQVDTGYFKPLVPHLARMNTRDRVNRELYLDTRFMMADSVLMKADKMSMKNSLELRVPFLDHRLVEYAARIPGHLKLDGFETKAIFRKALEGLLPEEIIYRGKQGYSLPVKNLLRTGLKSYLEERVLQSPLLRETMNMDFVRVLIAEHAAMKHNHNHILWGLLHTAIWYDTFFQSNRNGIR